MSNLDIKININKLLDYSESLGSTIEKKTLVLMIKSFSEYVLELYGRLIEESIYSNRYKGHWEPIEDEGYREYIGVTPVDNITLLIRESLESRKIGYHYVIRFKPNYRYPGTRLPISRVLRAIDSGTSKFHARPIFSKIIREINSHIYELWRGYLKMKGVV